MIELVTVMILIGILAAVAIPRMPDVNDFRALAFHDSVVGGLRFAQKTATSHRRVVCATFTASSMTLAIATAGGVDCSVTPLLAGALALPLSDGAASVISADPANARFDAVPGNLFFQPDGRITTDLAGANDAIVNRDISGKAIALNGSTGYVK